ncbi:MAG: HEAT repeat domain-containing protein [Polyangia bacterium]
MSGPEAVAALADVNQQKALPLLRKAMHDNRVEVRRAAADSLARIGGKEV